MTVFFWVRMQQKEVHFEVVVSSVAVELREARQSEQLSDLLMVLLNTCPIPGAALLHWAFPELEAKHWIH
jgi:hypothetical protein